jgi:hypothetical protein
MLPTANVFVTGGSGRREIHVPQMSPANIGTSSHGIGSSRTPNTALNPNAT